MENAGLDGDEQIRTMGFREQMLVVELEGRGWAQFVGDRDKGMQSWPNQVSKRIGFLGSAGVVILDLAGTSMRPDENSRRGNTGMAVSGTLRSIAIR